MKEKIMKIIFWILLILFTTAFAGTLIQLAMLFVFGVGDSRIVPSGLFWLVISYWAITKLKKKLNLPNLFKKS